MTSLKRDRTDHSSTYSSTRKFTGWLGFLASILTSLSAAAALGIAVTTAPPRSGPFCMFDTCITYPYTNAAEFVPTDYFWMYPAFLLGLIFVILFVCIHQTSANDKRIFSQIALTFAVISTVILASNYFIQLAVIQPSLLKGETEGLSLFSQYNPHGIFIALEDFGYLMMGTGFLFAGFVFNGHKLYEKVIRYLFIISGTSAIISLVILALIFGSNLEYIYECVVIVIDWLTLILGGIFLSVFFTKAGVSK